MADLAAIMDALGDALDTVSGLHAHPYYADKVVPPAAIVGWPDTYTYDKAMSRGADKVILPVTVVVGRADARSSRDRLAKYAAGSGADSVKTVVEAHVTDAYDTARVTDAEFGAVTIAAISYLAVTFNIDIYASGVI